MSTSNFLEYDFLDGREVKVLQSVGKCWDCDGQNNKNNKL